MLKSLKYLFLSEICIKEKEISTLNLKHFHLLTMLLIMQTALSC